MGIAAPSGDYASQMIDGLWPELDEDQLQARGDTFSQASSQLGKVMENWAREHHMIFHDGMWSGGAANAAETVLERRLNAMQDMRNKIDAAAKWYHDAHATVRDAKNQIISTVHNHQDAIGRISDDDQDRDTKIQNEITAAWNENSETVSTEGSKLGFKLEMPEMPPTTRHGKPGGGVDGEPSTQTLIGDDNRPAGTAPGGKPQHEARTLVASDSTYTGGAPGGKPQQASRTLVESNHVPSGGGSPASVPGTPSPAAPPISPAASVPRGSMPSPSGLGGGSSTQTGGSPWSATPGGGAQSASPMTSSGAPQGMSDAPQTQAGSGGSPSQPAAGNPDAGIAAAAAAAGSASPAVLPASAGAASTAAAAASAAASAGATPVAPSAPVEHTNAVTGPRGHAVDSGSGGGFAGGGGGGVSMPAMSSGSGGSSSPPPPLLPPATPPLAAPAQPGGGAPGAPGSGTPGGPGVHPASTAGGTSQGGIGGSLNSSHADAAPAPIPVSSARAQRDAIADATRRNVGGDALRVARRIAAALNAPDVANNTDFGFFWVTAVTSDGIIVVANSYGMAYIPEGVNLPEVVQLVSADSAVPAAERARWTTYPILAVQGWAAHHDVTLGAVIATDEQFRDFDPGTHRVVLSDDDIPASGKMAGRSRLEVVAPELAAQLATTSDLGLIDMLPPAPVDANPPADQRIGLWFNVVKSITSRSTNRGTAQLQAFVTYAAHAQELALHQAHTGVHAIEQRSAVADWLYWQQLTILMAEALAVSATP